LAFLDFAFYPSEVFFQPRCFWQRIKMKLRHKRLLFWEKVESKFDLPENVHSQFSKFNLSSSGRVFTKCFQKLLKFCVTVRFIVTLLANFSKSDYIVINLKIHLQYIKFCDLRSYFHFNAITARQSL
jgi:hypothetical protein